MEHTQSFYAALHFKYMRMKQTASVSVIAPCSLHAISIICSLKLLRSVCGGKGDVSGGEKKERVTNNQLLLLESSLSKSTRGEEPGVIFS